MLTPLCITFFLTIWYTLIVNQFCLLRQWQSQTNLRLGYSNYVECINKCSYLLLLHYKQRKTLSVHIFHTYVQIFPHNIFKLMYMFKWFRVHLMFETLAQSAVYTIHCPFMCKDKI